MFYVASFLPRVHQSINPRTPETLAFPGFGCPSGITRNPLTPQRVPSLSSVRMSPSPWDPTVTVTSTGCLFGLNACSNAATQEGGGGATGDTHESCPPMATCYSSIPRTLKMAGPEQRKGTKHHKIWNVGWTILLKIESSSRELRSGKCHEQKQNDVVTICWVGYLLGWMRIVRCHRCREKNRRETTHAQG